MRVRVRAMILLLGLFCLAGGSAATALIGRAGRSSLADTDVTLSDGKTLVDSLR